MITSNYSVKSRAEFLVRKWGNNAVREAKVILAVNCYKNYWVAVVEEIERILDHKKLENFMKDQEEKFSQTEMGKNFLAVDEMVKNLK